MAVALSAISTSTGKSPALGSANAIGLLPTMASAPPGAGISGRVFDITMPTQSCVRHQARIAAGGAEMEGIAHRDGRHADLASRARRASCDRLLRGELAERIRGVDHDRAVAIVADDLADGCAWTPSP